MIRNTLVRASRRHNTCVTGPTTTKRAQTKPTNKRPSVLLARTRSYTTHQDFLKDTLDYMRETNDGVDIGIDVHREYYSEHSDETPTSAAVVESTKVHTDGKRIFSRQEVGKHDTENDCWFIIRAKVYNITEWLNFAPCSGAPSRLVEFAGRDATLAFESQSHSWKAMALLEDFHIGWCFEKPRYTIINGPTYASNERRYNFGIASDRWNTQLPSEDYKWAEMPSDQDLYDPKGSVRDVPDKAKYAQPAKEEKTAAEAEEATKEEEPKS